MKIYTLNKVSGVAFRLYSIIFALTVVTVQADFGLKSPDSTTAFFGSSSFIALVGGSSFPGRWSSAFLSIFSSGRVKSDQGLLYQGTSGYQYAVKTISAGGKSLKEQPDIIIYLNNAKPEIPVRVEISKSEKNEVLEAIFKRADKEDSSPIHEEFRLKYVPGSNQMILILSGKEFYFYTSGEIPDFSDNATLAAHMVDPATTARIKNIQSCYQQLSPLHEASSINITCDNGVLQSADGVYFIYTASEPLYLPEGYQEVISKQEGATYALGVSHTLEFDGYIGCRQSLNLLYQSASFRSCAGGDSTQSGGGGGGAGAGAQGSTPVVTIVVYTGSNKFNGGGGGKKPPSKGSQLKSGHELPFIPKSKKNGKKRDDKRGFNSGAHKKQNASRK